MFAVNLMGILAVIASIHIRSVIAEAAPSPTYCDEPELSPPPIVIPSPSASVAPYVPPAPSPIPSASTGIVYCDEDAAIHSPSASIAPVLLVNPSSSSAASPPLASSINSIPAPAPSPSTGASPSQDSASCPCGYTLAAHKNAYFPRHYTLDFSTIPDQTPSSSSSLAEIGWVIKHDSKVGGANPDGVKCVGKAENIRITNGVLELTMPGGQVVDPAVKELYGAEMRFGETAIRGVFAVRGKVSKEPGACQAFWTEYHDKQAGNKDEQDMEILGHALMDEGTLGAGEYGLWMTNWDPTDTTNERREHTTWHFPQDPSLDFHNYTIGWLPDGTHYYFDGLELPAPAQYTSVNPSDMTINCWANGNKGWSQGPPVNDVVLRVNLVDFYYATEADGDGPPDGCTLEQACKVA